MNQLILLIDALGYDSIMSGKMPQLYEIFQKGTFRPVKTLLGFSNGIIPSIFSGKYPFEHNIWALYKISPKTSPFKKFNLFPSFIFDKTLLTRYFANKMIFKQCKRHDLVPHFLESVNIPLTIMKYFDISMKKNIIEPNSMGTTPTLFDLLRRRKINCEYVGFPWNKGTEEILNLTAKHLNNNKHVFAYLVDIDHYGHLYGVNSIQFSQSLKKFDTLCANFLKSLKLNEIDVTIFSDHGMRDIEGFVDVENEIKSSGLKIGIDYLPFFDSTMARFTTLNEQAEIRLTELLNKIKGGRLLSNKELIKYKINFKSQEYGNLIYLANPGNLIFPNFYTVLKKSKSKILGKGMHGWEPEDKLQNSFIYSNQKLAVEPSDVTQIFHSLTKFFGI